ncbi:hypothetical protein ACVWXO_010825 [Bradyrhizobium sp. LM2.7]
MRESRTYGSVRGALSNERPYRDRCARNDETERRIRGVLDAPPAAFAKASAPHDCKPRRSLGVAGLRGMTVVVDMAMEHPRVP